MVVVGLAGAEPVALFSPPGVSGSGTHIGQGKFITAYHVIQDAPNGTLAGTDESNGQVEILTTSKEYDVALVQYRDFKGRATPYECREPRVGEEITIEAYPLDYGLVQFWGRVAGMPREIGPWARIYPVDMTAIPGMSGGGIKSKNGKMIGVLVGMGQMDTEQQRGKKDLIAFHIGFVVPMSDVCKQLGMTAGAPGGTSGKRGR